MTMMEANPLDYNGALAPWFAIIQIEAVKEVTYSQMKRKSGIRKTEIGAPERAENKWFGE